MNCPTNCPCGQNPEQRPVPASAQAVDDDFIAWWNTGEGNKAGDLRGWLGAAEAAWQAAKQQAKLSDHCCANGCAHQAAQCPVWKAGERPPYADAHLPDQSPAEAHAKPLAPPNLALAEALEEYWDAAWQEGREDRHHDTEDGRAQKALMAVYSAIYAAQPQPKGTERVYRRRTDAEALDCANRLNRSFPPSSLKDEAADHIRELVAVVQAPAVKAEPVVDAARALSEFFWDNNLGHVPAHLVANLRDALRSHVPVQGTGGANG